MLIYLPGSNTHWVPGDSLRGMIGLDVYLYPDGIRVAQPEDVLRWEKEKELYDPNVRLFVALFPYNPSVMSPNPDTSEELPFERGQIIKVSSAKITPAAIFLYLLYNQRNFVIDGARTPCNIVLMFYSTVKYIYSNFSQFSFRFDIMYCYNLFYRLNTYEMFFLH